MKLDVRLSVRKLYLWLELQWQIDTRPPLLDKVHLRSLGSQSNVNGFIPCCYLL